jgi:FAD:protein FMN transferase
VNLGRLAFIGAVLLALAYFALRGPVAVADPRFLKQDFLALGTLVSVSLYLPETMPRERGRALVAEAEKFLRDYEEAWRPSGPGRLGGINRALADGRTFALSGPEAMLFTRAEDARRRSGGLFDARLGALVALWGFDDEARRRSEPPPAAEVARLAAAVQRAPAFEEGAAYGPAPGVQWDFGGIAKGAAVEEAVQRFKAAGVSNVIVNAGGNLRTAGARGKAPWRIGIRHPRGRTPDEVLAYLLAEGDEALITSGDYERYFEHGGRRYAHILDPRTGLPASGLQSVTVAHADTAWADVASTALFVAGAEGWREAAAALGVEQALVVTAAGEIVVTRALARRLKFMRGHEPRVVP